MLQLVKVENFRCFRSLQVPLRPITVLVGPNDTGKSAFLAALTYLVNGYAIQDQDHWRQDRSLNVTFANALTDGSLASHAKQGEMARGGMPSMRPTVLFNLPTKGVQLQSGGIPDGAEPPLLNESGENLAGVLDYMLRRERGRFFRVVEVMKNLVPGLDDLNIGSPEAPSRRIEMTIEQGFKTDPGLTSAGVRLLLIFVTLAYQPRPPKLILIEEPENGIHPKRLVDVMKLFREIAKGMHGDNAAQIVMTTHSPYLLDLVDMEKDHVLVFRRNPDGSRSAELVDTERLKPFIGEFLLGEVWYNQGEEGLVKRKA